MESKTCGSNSPSGYHEMAIPPALSAASTSDLKVLTPYSGYKIMNETTTTPDPKKTFGYRTRTTIGFWNVQTLHDNDCNEDIDSSKILQLEKEIARLKIDILGLSETHWRGNGCLSTTTSKCCFLFSGAAAGSRKAAGVGFLMTPQAQKSLMSWNPVSDRIITARFRSRVRNITIIQCYAPTNVKHDSLKEAFYSELSATYKCVPKGDIIIVMGDFNASVGERNAHVQHIMGKHGIGARTDNGERFIDFCNTNDLVIGGTLFPHKKCHKITWVSPGGSIYNQIDHFAISRRFRGCLLDVRSKSSADLGTIYDHRLMLAKIRLRTAAVQQNNTAIIKRARCYYLDRLKDPNILSSFKSKIEQRALDVLAVPSPSMEQRWSSLKSAYHEVGSECLGPQPKGLRPWMTTETWQKIQERAEIKLSLIDAQSHQRAELADLYRKKQREVKQCVKKDKRSFTMALVRAAEDAADRGDSRNVYKITKELIGKALATEHPIKDANGKLIHGDDDQITRWRDHFFKVLNHMLDENASLSPTYLPNLPTMRIKEDSPTLTEIADAIRSLPNNKAAGVDGLPAEFFKAQPMVAAGLLHPLIDATWVSEKFPEEWNEGIIVKIPKKGDLRDCNNWRGICVLPAIAKIIAKIILERLKNHIFATIDASQAGFRPGSSCADHINTVRIIIEQCAAYKQDLHLLFIDFEKAFDSVQRESLWRALRRRGVPEKITNIIKATYNGAKCRVLHKGKLSEQFEIRSGVRQGCILSPVLFLLVINDVLEAALNPLVACGLRWKMPSIADNLKHIDYADDICLLAEKLSDVAKMSNALNTHALKAGLKINIGKTKLLSLPASERTISICDEPIENVESFTYLGCEMAKGGGTTEDVEKRICKARGVFGMMSPIWRNSNLRRCIKLRLFVSNVLSVLLYGSSSWKITEAVTRRLQVFVNRCLRNIFRIFWPNKISNVELLRLANMEPVNIMIRRQKWRWIGHTLRKDDSCIAKKAMEWNPVAATGRSRGRPPETWRTTVQKEADLLQKSWNELREIAKNRTRWRVGVVAALCPP